MSQFPLARFISDLTALNTLNSRIVKVFFQKSPGKPDGDTRGIKDLEFRVLDGSDIIQSGTTGDDGLIEVEVRSDFATLQILVSGAPVSTYLISPRDAAPEDNATIPGVQRRLRALGYHLGDAGDDQNGVDGKLGPATDRAIHDFQTDQKLTIDGSVGDKTRSALDDALNSLT